jgi:hypothetical protein
MGWMKGTKGPTTRLGAGLHGFNCCVNGWDSGVHVHAHVDEKGNDSFLVWATGGSNNERKCLIANLRYVNGEVIVEFPEEIADIANSLWHEGPVPRINNE